GLIAGPPLTGLLDRYQIEGVNARYGSIESRPGDKLEGDHQPQKGLLWHAANVVHAGRKLFGDRKLGTEVAPTSAVRGGEVINLHVYRHRAGRTWGNKSQATLGPARSAVDAAAGGTGTDDARRGRVLDVIRGEL